MASTKNVPPSPLRLGRSRASALLLVLGTLLGACGSSSSLPSPVIVITIDTLRADRLSCYGYERETSPNIDRFAAEAILFEHASTTMATTLPAHVSLWTSRYPLQTGVVANDARLNVHRESKTPFFAQLMRDQGYRTAAFVSATPVKRESGLDVGFEVYDQPEAKERRAEETTDRALAWIDAHAGEPFFLWLHYFDPHYPYEPPSPYHRAFKTDDTLLAFMRARRFDKQDDPLLQGINNQYDGEILYTDHHLERLFQGLRDHGLFAESTIALTADHGEGLGQHGHIGHGRIFEEHTHIPLILKLPASRGHAPERRAELASIVDIVPTLVANLGLPIAADGFEGVDLLASERAFVFAQRSIAERWGEGEKYTLRTQTWKLHHSTDARDELFDLADDPYELFDHLDREGTRGMELRDELLGYLGDLASRGTGLEVLRDLSDQTIEDLKKLGYLGGEDPDSDSE